MKDNRQTDSTIAVLLRGEASKKVEEAIFAIDGLAKSIFFVAADGELVDEKAISIIELAKVIEEKVSEIRELTIDDLAEFVELIDNRLYPMK